MDLIKSRLFRAAYYLYTNTSVGYYYHAHNLNLAEKKFASTPVGSHSCTKTCHFGPNISVTVVPFCMDNYSYIIVDKLCNTAVIIDPGHADPIVQFFAQRTDIKPIAVACTHKHWDHCAGNYALLQKYPDLLIFASEDDGAYLSNRTFRDSETLQLERAFTSAKIVAYEMPGHTVGHALFCVTPTTTTPSLTMSSTAVNHSLPSAPTNTASDVQYGATSCSNHGNNEEVISTSVIQEQPQSNGTSGAELSASSHAYSPETPPLLFTGDCLFLNGIGKMFECPSVVMAATLQRIVDKFPDDTLVFPGHEYTLSFINFTLTSDVDPLNSEVQERLKEVQGQVNRHDPSVPAKLGLEKLCNPYLRTVQLSKAKGDFLGKNSSDVIQILADKKSTFSKIIATSNSNSSSLL